MGVLTFTIALEVGHRIGFCITDYTDSNFSCGGAPSDEGESSVGANYIPGTPTGSEENSWMLACSGGTNKAFTTSDQEALDHLY